MSTMDLMTKKKVSLELMPSTFRELRVQIIFGMVTVAILTGCSSGGGPKVVDPPVATVVAPVAPAVASITVTAPNPDNLWYAVYYSKKGRDKILENLNGISDRVINPISTLKRCVKTLTDADVPVGASGAVTAVYYDSKNGKALVDSKGDVIVECIRGQTNRPLDEMVLDEPINDNACSGGSVCIVWKYGVQYCRC